MKKYKILIIGGRAYAQVGIAFMSVYSPSQQQFSNGQVVTCVPMHGSTGPYLRCIEEEQLVDTETDTVEEVVTKTKKGA